MVEVEWVALVGLVAKILCKFELEGRVYREDERRKKKNRERRRESLSEGLRAALEEKRGVRKLLVYPSLLYVIYFWSKLINT